MHVLIHRRSSFAILLLAFCGSAGATDTVIQDCAQCPRMVPIAPGSFMMGEPGPFVPVELHPATIKERFAIGETEVTRAQFRYFAGRTGYVGGSDDDGSADASLPVTGVDWYAARAYTRWLSRYTGQRYRLPYEEEWEYAARAGTGTRYWWGDGREGVCGNEHVAAVFFSLQEPPCAVPASFAVRLVAGLRANPWGLFDMLGNADEWMGGCFPASLGKYKEPWVDSCFYHDDPRVVRGASEDVLAIGRKRLDPFTRSATLGFRVVRELK